MFRKVTDQDIDNAPTEKWGCNKCGSRNTGWRINLNWISKKSDRKYNHAHCDACLLENEKDEERRRKFQEAQEQRRYSQALLRNSRLTPKLQEASIDQMKFNDGNQNAYEVLRDISPGDDWVYLLGGNGTGKSWLMAITLKRLLKDLQIPALYIHETRFFDEIRESFGTGTDSRIEILNQVKRAKIVFWDEFMITNVMRKKSDWYQQCIFSMLDTMDEYKKTVVFASNIDPHLDPRTMQRQPWVQAKARLGKRITSRLERNYLSVIHLTNNPFYKSTREKQSILDEHIPTPSLN